MTSLLFQTENRGRLPTWANPKLFWTLSGQNIKKMILSDNIAKALSFPFKKQMGSKSKCLKSESSFFLVHCELSSHKDGWFNMKTIWAGSLLMPKCQIPVKHFLLGLCEITNFCLQFYKFEF